MYQTIALSPLIFEQLNEEQDEELFDEIISQLKTETILSDSKRYILEEMFDIVKNISNDDNKVILKKLLSRITLISPPKLLCGVASKTRSYNKLKNLTTEIELAKANSEWKIIVGADSNERAKLLSYSSNLEIVTLRHYFTPSENSSIRTKIEIIEKNENDTFDLYSWIRKFTKDAKKLLIFDGYLGNKFEITALRKILATVPTNASIKIITFTDKSRKSNNEQFDQIQIEKELNDIKIDLKLEKFNYELIDDKKKMKDRYLVTDKFHITLGHSIGSTDKINKVHRHFELKSTVKKIGLDYWEKGIDCHNVAKILKLVGRSIFEIVKLKNK